MRMKRALSQLVYGESGTFLVTAIVLAIIVAIVAIGIIDGASVFYAYEASKDISEEAAKAATDELKLSHNETRAAQVAVDYCESRDLEFIEIVRRPDLGGVAFQVTCEKDASTYVFKSLPWFKDMVNQRNSGTAYRSI